MDRLRRVWPVLLLFIAPIVPLWRAILKAETIGPFDQIRQMAPWNGPAPKMPWDVLQADGVLQFYPWRDLVLTSWGRLEPPFWNPYQLAGTPLLANSQSGGFYPPHILLGLLHIPTGWSITILAWLHLFWAGLGVFTLVRKLGGTEIGAVVAGLSFSLSAFMLGWLPLASVVTTASWIPWVLLNVVDVYRGRPAGAILGLALSTAMMVLSGHLQFVAYGLMAAGVTLVVQFLTNLVPQRRGHLRVDDNRSFYRSPVAGLLGLGLGICLAAPQLLPVLEYSKFSHRRNTPSEEGYQAFIGSAISPADVLSRLVNPYSQGNPTERLSDDLPYSTFWPAIARPGPNWAESAATLGPIVLLLLCLVPLAGVDWRRAGSVLAVTVLALLLAVGTPLNKLLYMYVPGWSSTGSPSRVILLFVMGGCILAGLAPNDKLLAVGKRPLAMAFAAFVLLLVLSLVPTSAPAPPVLGEDAWASIVATGNLTGYPVALLGVLFAAGGVAAFLLGKTPTQKRLIGIVPVAFAMVAYGSIVRTGDASFLQADSATGYERVAAPYEAWGLVTAAPAILPPNSATALRVHDLAGYDSLLHRETVALLNDINGKDSAPEANGNIMLVKPSADRAKLAEAGVTRLLKKNGQISLPGPGRLTVSTGSAKIVQENLHLIRIEVSGSGRLILRDRNLAGWSATIDGKPALIQGTLWREVDIPPGAEIVEMRYVPPGLVAGFWLLLPGVLGVGWLAGISRSSKRRKSKGLSESAELPLAEAA